MDFCLNRVPTIWTACRAWPSTPGEKRPNRPNFHQVIDYKKKSARIV